MVNANTKFSIFKKSSKAQMIGQIFIFILAGLVFILIIGYGYKAIQYFMERQEQVILVDFRSDLEIAIEGVKRDYGTIRKLRLKLPSKYHGICFFDSITCAESPPELILYNQKISVAWAQAACKTKSANVFIIPRALDLDFPDIEVDNGYVCIPNLDGVTIKLEGTGRKAKISPWPRKV